MMKKSVKLLATISILVAAVCLSGCMQQGIPPDMQAKLDQYVEYWNTGEFDGIENVLHEDFELMESPAYEPERGIDLFKQKILDMKVTYPDCHLVIDEVLYDKDKIAARWTWSATNTGPGNFPPTGKTLNGQGLSIIHFKDGKIKDEWLANNNLLWLLQLGFTVVPPEPVSPE